MKVQFNMTTSSEDLDRFTDQADLLQFMDGFDGVELMYYGEDEKHLIPKEKVVGVHLGYFPYWFDFWNGDEEALVQEFGSMEQCEKVYGGKNREVLLEKIRHDLKIAHAYGAEYVVYHATDARIEETFTGKYGHTDEEVIDGLISFINELLKEEDGSLLFLVENLWQPGFSFTRPEMTKRLLDGIQYEKKGIMLDTGHLFHTDTSVRTQEEGIAYIHKQLDAHGELCRYIKGIHLNQSQTGALMEETAKNPPTMAKNYEERMGQMFWYAFEVDQHLPFTADGIQELVQRINPEYLTFEFITADRNQHMDYLTKQRKALHMI